MKTKQSQDRTKTTQHKARPKKTSQDDRQHRLDEKQVWTNQVKAGREKTDNDKTRQYKDKDKTRQDKARQGNTRQDKTRQHKTTLTAFAKV
jgi:hypothetical protein